MLIDLSNEHARAVPDSHVDPHLERIVDDLSGLTFAVMPVEPRTEQIDLASPYLSPQVSGMVIPASPSSTTSFHTVLDDQTPTINSPPLFPIAYVSRRSSIILSPPASPIASLSKQGTPATPDTGRQLAESIAFALQPHGYSDQKVKAISAQLLGLSEKDRLKCMLSEEVLKKKIALAIQLVELEEEEEEEEEL